ncbi:OLC1v1038863C1 [Oldenlandia corymbosa var. corymbosa]|uniref:OLC1v1038863C1 n=1 Tax=Oldenlandia corymbosa var. corymbosa TaxID=529605 RepID=A0AAV1D1Y8_OLDCO|nr:OLC1v1038863C1 [Oldenlandia corymbosa var. corymbosa]
MAPRRRPIWTFMVCCRKLPPAFERFFRIKGIGSSMCGKIFFVSPDFVRFADYRCGLGSPSLLLPVLRRMIPWVISDKWSRMKSNGSHTHKFCLEDLAMEMVNNVKELTRLSYFKQRIVLRRDGKDLKDLETWDVFSTNALAKLW